MSKPAESSEPAKVEKPAVEEKSSITEEQKAELEAMLVMTEEEKAVYDGFEQKYKDYYDKRAAEIKAAIEADDYVEAKACAEDAEWWLNTATDEQRKTLTADQILTNVPSYSEYIKNNPVREHTLGYVEGSRFMWTDQMTCWDTDKLRNDDGMTEAEIKQMIEELTEETYRKEREEQERVEKFDSNGDGEVSFEERMQNDKEFAEWYNRQYEKALHQWEEDAGMKAAQQSDYNIPLS